MRSASGFKQRLQIILFYLLLTAAAAMLSWLSQRHVLIWDWSDNARNSLSDTSKHCSIDWTRPLKSPALLRTTRNCDYR